MTAAQYSHYDSGGREHDPLTLKLLQDLVKVLMEVGVKDPADRELSQMFPTDYQNTSGFTKSVWFLSLQADHTHHRLLIS